MVHLRLQSIIYFDFATKSQIPPQKDVLEITHESVYEAHLRMLLKVRLMMQIDANSCPLKHEGKSAVFSAPGDAKESAKRASLLRVHQRIYHFEI